MEEYELTTVRVRNAHGTFAMECEDGTTIEFELSSIGRDHVHLVPPDGAANGFEGLRAPLLWVMSGPDNDAQETPAVLRVALAHTIFVADGNDVRTIDLPVAERLYAIDWTFNSEVPAQEWPAAVFPPGREFKSSTSQGATPLSTGPVTSDRSECHDDH
ncbi:hypothetical protein [Demequina sp.]|uniref:hypothetical protein n=1 Tax=Demequina sp. TaxID=2050685 RepID=UPI003A891A04